MSDKSQATFAIGEILDLERYPLADLESDRGRRLLDRCRRASCVPKEPANSIASYSRCRPRRGRQGTCTEGNGVSHRGCPQRLLRGYPSRRRAEDDLRAVTVRSAKRALSWKHVDAASPLRTLYEWDGLVSFLREVLELPSLYRDADPVGACSVMFYDERRRTRMALRQQRVRRHADAPGVRVRRRYEYVPAIRSAEDENADAVRAVLAGNRELVRSFDIEPGTLTLFRGRYSLHRVTPVVGAIARLNAVLAYASVPDHQLEPLTRELFYGPIS